MIYREVADTLTTGEPYFVSAVPPLPMAPTIGPVMSESAATAWIIDRLEIENTKMEEEMGTMESCEEDSNGGNSGGSIFH